MKILILLIAILPNYCLAKEIIHDAYKFNIPDSYNVAPALEGDDNGVILIMNENKKVMFSIKKERKDNKRFYQPKDYGVTSHREMFYQFFRDTPTKNKAVLEFRKMNKEYDLQKIIISEKNGFVFFRRNNLMNNLRETSIYISTPINDDVIVMYFMDITDNKFVDSVINSLDIN